MNENLNLVEILKDCPKLTKLYSTIFGEVEFIECDNLYQIIVLKEAKYYCFKSEGVFIFKGIKYNTGECTLFPSKDQRDWSKFIAPWCTKERDTIDWLEKQGEISPILSNSLNNGKNEQKSADKIEPKFKVGNWYQCTKYFFGKGVTFDKNTAYYCAIEGCLQDEYGCHIAIVKDLYDNFKLWTIQDAKDGDVICYRDEISLYKHDIKNCTKQETTFGGFVYYCCYDGKRFITDSLYMLTKKDEIDIHPATKEQRDVLMKAMNNAGYKWNAKTKTFGKLVESKFDPKTLQPFDKVLGFFNGVWNCDLYSHYYNDDRIFPYVCFRSSVNRVIPYNEETKHLVGTTEEAPEFYRYWED